MRGLKELSRKELEDLVVKVVDTLWTDDGFRFDNTKEWSQDEIEEIALEFTMAGFHPQDQDDESEAREQYMSWLRTRTA